MTYQIKDKVVFLGGEYDLLERKGSPLVHSRDFGMEAVGTHTANHRGYFAKYEIVEGRLLLRDFSLRERAGNYVPINGIRPKIEHDFAEYKQVGLSISFSGLLRLAKDIDLKLHFSRGNSNDHDPTAYATLIDLAIIDGAVLTVINRSHELRDTLQLLSPRSWGKTGNGSVPKWLT